MEELINRVLKSESTKKVWRKDYNSNEFKEASAVNKLLNDIPLNRSPKCECLEDLFFQLKRINLKQTINTMKNKQFFLKDVVIMLHGCQPISNKSTDEQMISLLKLSPAHISKFENYPKNWKEICEIEEKETEEETPEVEEPVIEEIEEETPEDNSRELELYSMKNGELKVILLKLVEELPKPAKKNDLIKAILEAENK